MQGTRRSDSRSYRAHLQCHGSPETLSANEAVIREEQVSIAIPEAAHFAVRYDDTIRRWIRKKTARAQQAQDLMEQFVAAEADHSLADRVRAAIADNRAR